MKRTAALSESSVLSISASAWRSCECVWIACVMKDPLLLDSEVTLWLVSWLGGTMQSSEPSEGLSESDVGWMKLCVESHLPSGAGGNHSHGQLCQISPSELQLLLAVYLLRQESLLLILWVFVPLNFRYYFIHFINVTIVPQKVPWGIILEFKKFILLNCAQCKENNCGRLRKTKALKLKPSRSHC